MALIICPECEGKVSDTAISCPHCGYAKLNGIDTKPETPSINNNETSKKTIKKNKKTLIIVSIIVVLILLVVLSFSQSIDKDVKKIGQKSLFANIVSSIMNIAHTEDADLLFCYAKKVDDGVLNVTYYNQKMFGCYIDKTVSYDEERKILFIVYSNHYVKGECDNSIKDESDEPFILKATAYIDKKHTEEHYWDDLVKVYDNMSIGVSNRPYHRFVIIQKPQ